MAGRGKAPIESHGDICPGITLIERMFEEKFEEFKEAAKNGFQTSYEQGTGVAWDSRQDVKDTLAWAKKEMNVERKIKSVTWAAIGSIVSGLTVWAIKTL